MGDFWEKSDFSPLKSWKYLEHFQKSEKRSLFWPGLGGNMKNTIFTLVTIITTTTTTTSLPGAVGVVPIYYHSIYIIRLTPLDPLEHLPVTSRHMLVFVVTGRPRSGGHDQVELVDRPCLVRATIFFHMLGRRHSQCLSLSYTRISLPEIGSSSPLRCDNHYPFLCRKAGRQQSPQSPFWPSWSLPTEKWRKIRAN